MEYKRIRHPQVILDPENPRLPDGTSSDKEAINRLIDDGYDHLLALARDLVHEGSANPAELPILLKDGSKYLALEGNRRFAALKLLEDPKLADDPAHQAAFKRIAARGTPPADIFSVIADSREQFDHWITLRHTGANDGVGAKPWRPEQSARHRRRMRASVDAGTLRSIAMADELTEAYQADDDLVATIQRVRAAKLTNIGRLFSGDVLSRLQLDIRQAAGVTSQERTLWARHDAQQLHEFFVWAFSWLDAESVDTFKNPEVRTTLLNNRASLLPSFDDAQSEPTRLADRPYSPPLPDDDEVDPTTESDDIEGEESEDHDGGTGGSSTGDEKDGGGEDGDTSKGGGRQRDRKPERCVYSAVRLPNLPSPVQRILREAQGVVMEDNPYIATVLTRVVLELTVSAPNVLAWSGSTENKPLDKKIRACLFKLDPNIDNRKQKRADLAQAFAEVDGFGVEYLHKFVHNSMMHADHHLARRFSAAFTPLLISINASVTPAP